MHLEPWKSSLISLLPAHSFPSNQSSSLKHFWTLKHMGFPHGLDGEDCPHCGRLRFDPWLRKIPWRRQWQPTPVFFPWEFNSGGLEFMGSQRVRHNAVTNSITFYQTHTYTHTPFSAVTTVLSKCMPLLLLLLSRFSRVRLCATP